MFNKILSLFFKSNCSICQRSTGQIICEYCTKQLKSCELTNYTELWKEELPIFIWGKYQGYLKRAIATFKFESHPEIGDILGEWLARSWLDCGFNSRYQKVTVTPIPMHQQKQKERGFNQAELIARRFCQITGYPLKSNLLKRVRNTEAMFSLKPIQRLENIKDALTIGKDYPHFNRQSSVLIIDDIYTTGTTVNEANKILKQHQINVLGVAVIASPFRDT